MHFLFPQGRKSVKSVRISRNIATLSELLGSKNKQFRRIYRAFLNKPNEKVYNPTKLHEYLHKTEEVELLKQDILKA
jgi:hypothetical protein